MCRAFGRVLLPSYILALLHRSYFISLRSQFISRGENIILPLSLVQYYYTTVDAASALVRIPSNRYSVYQSSIQYYCNKPVSSL